MSVAAERRGAWHLGGVAAATGLGIGVVLFVVRNVGEETRPPSAWLEEGTLAVIVLAPFVLAVLAQGFQPALRAATWIGVGLVTAVLGFMTLISGIGVVFLAVGFVQIRGGFRALPTPPAGFVTVALAAALVVATAVIAPVASLFLFPPTPVCWELRTEGEEPTWRRVPVRGAAVDRAYGTRGLFGTCSSDTVTPTEAGVAAGVWLAAGAGLVVWNHRKAAA
ncbi:MAG: hypothetical protein ACRDHV_00130 [Actinomycetota bacterium]